MIRAQVPTSLGVTAVCVLLCGCIPVKNLESAWAGGEVDDRLLGQWLDEADPDGRIAFVATGQGYQITASTMGLEGGAKSIAAGDQHYLMVVQLSSAVLGFGNADEDAKSGNLLRYVARGDELTIYQYEQETLGMAIEAGNVPGEALEDEAPTLLELDEPTLEWLANIGDEAAGWSKTVYRRTPEAAGVG